MKHAPKWIFFISIITFLPLCNSGAQDEDTMVLVAGQASLVKAQTWIDFLKKNGITVDHYVLSELGKVKNNKYITIMGGLDEAGFREVITEIVGADEAAALVGKGAKKMLLKENLWIPGQKILVFAGADAEAAAAIRAESRAAWMKYLEEWFDLEEMPGGLRPY
jgi:hypothetical protein